MNKPFVPYRYLKNSAQSAQKMSRLRKIIPSVMITLGSVLIANVAWPIISYQLFVSPEIQRPTIISPLPQKGITRIGELPQPQTPQVLGDEIDFTKVENWFPTAPKASGSEQKVKNYYISIPAVDVENALVEINGTELDEHLIHYSGTSMPGQLGSPVIFGHSVLRQFYDPAITNPNRYMSIFSKIMTLKTGDEIIVDYEGVRYIYQVTDKVEVKPEDTFILQQQMNNRELKLVTCVPEGTYLRRGVVIAQLVDLN